VGGATLATILTQLKYRASVAACGLAGGNDLSTTVIPFLLRRINLIGIDSVMCPEEPRLEAWRRLARDLSLEKLDRMIEEIPLSQVAGLASRILGGQIRGRTVIDVHR
jgi:acrylyl-CoA reductase (NADPH)